MSIGSTNWSPASAAPSLPAMPAAAAYGQAPMAWGGDAYQQAQAGQAWGNAANAWGNAAYQTGNALGEMAQGAAHATGQAYQAVAPVVVEGAQAAGQVLGQAAQGTWNLAGQAYGALAPAFVESVKETGGLFASLGRGLKQGLSGVGDWLSEPVGQQPQPYFPAQPYPQGPVAWPSPAPQWPVPPQQAQPQAPAPQWPAPQAPVPQAAPQAAVPQAPTPCPCPEGHAPVRVPMPYPVYVPVPVPVRPHAVDAYPVPVQSPQSPVVKPQAPVLKPLPQAPQPEVQPKRPVWHPGAQTPWDKQQLESKPAAGPSLGAPVTWSKPLSEKELAFLGKHNKAAFFAALRPMAEAAEKQSGVPAEIILAHAALQSAWGSKTLGAFNLFGHGQQGGRRAYTSFAQAIQAHADLLSHGRYAAPLAAYQSRHDLKAYAQAMGRVYAEDPQHGAKLMQLIQQHKLA